MATANFIKEKILWLLLPIGLLAMFVIVAGVPIGNPPLAIAVYLLPAITVWLFTAWTIGFARAMLLILAAGIIGGFFEFLGLTYGTFFGGEYVYRMAMANIAGVPIGVIIYWAVFICLGYSISNALLYWGGREKPSLRRRDGWMLVGLILLDGFIVTALDLFMDPIMVKAGAWTWLQGGRYFGVPLGNFLGWFTIAVLSTAIVRGVEYFYPVPRSGLPISAYLIPVIIYLGGAVIFMIAALKMGMGSFSFIGGLGMFIVMGVSLGMWIGYRRHGVVRRGYPFPGLNGHKK